MPCTKMFPKQQGKTMGIVTPCVALFVSDFDVNWLKCAFCNKWVHSICEGMIGAEFLKLSKNRKSYRCLRCQGREREEIGSLIEEKFSQLEERQEIIEGKILELEKECVGYQDQLKDEQGPREKRLLAKLDEIHVVCQAYHGHVFVGNHCKVILKNFDVLLSVLHDKQLLQAKFTQIFSCYANLAPLLFKRSFLSQEQIDKVCMLC